MFKHANVKATHPAIRWDSGTIRKMYIIETDLPLSEDDRFFDEKALNELMSALEAYLKTRSDYHGYEIIPFRPR